MILSPQDRIQAVDYLTQRLVSQYQYDSYNLNKMFSYGWKGVANMSDDQIINQLNTHRHADSNINSFLIRVVEDNLVNGGF